MNPTSLSSWFNRAIVVFSVGLALSAWVVWNSANDLSALMPWHGGAYYIGMIAGQTAPPPMAYRILVPLLCFGSTLMGYVWMVIGMALTSYGVFVLTGMVGGNVRAQWLAMLLWSFWGVGAGLASYGFIIPDPLAWACLIWASIWALRGRLLEAVAILIIGVMVREIVLMGLPFVIAVAVRKQFKDYLLVAVPVLWFVAALILIEPAAPYSPNDTLNPLKMFMATLAANQGMYFQWGWFWSPWYMLFLLAVAGYSSLTEKRLLWYLAVLSGLFLATDVARMVVFTFPLLLPLSGMGLNALISRLDKPQALFVASALLIIHASRSYDLGLMMILTAALLIIPLRSKLKRRAGAEDRPA